MKYPGLKQTLYAISLLFVLPHSASFAADQSTNIFIIDCKTTAAYGLHSYFLFSQPPVFEAQADALKQIEFLLRKIHKIKQLNPNTTPEQQHAIYIPVSFEPQSWILQPQEGDFDAAARWVMQNYDYQCAKTLLKPFPKLLDNGPYMLSSTQKLLSKNFTSTTSVRNPVLAQNLSTIEPLKSLYWLDMFFKKSWQPRQWQNDNVAQLREMMLESLFHSESLKEEETQSTLLPESQTKALPAQEPSPIFIELGDNKTVVSLINPAQNYPVTEVTHFPHNPYTDKITIQFSSDAGK